MLHSRPGRLLILATVALLATSAAVRAETPQILLDRFGINVNMGTINGQYNVQKRYLYSPFLGAYTLGPDQNLEGLNASEFQFKQSLLPQGDPTLLGPIPYVSGAVNPFDQNRIQIKEGINEAAPAPWRFPDRIEPWYSTPEGDACASAFSEAWIFSSDVIAPEVEVFSVRLPNQKIGTETMIIGATKKDFPIVVGSAYGQILLKDGAKALVARSLDGLRVLNLTGRKNSVMVKLASGKIIGLGPGSELVASKSKERLMVPPADGIARRGVSPMFTTDDIYVAVNEFSTHTVLRATGLHRALATVGDTPERRLCHHVMKTSAALAMMRGAGGFNARPTDAVLAEKSRPAPAEKDAPKHKAEVVPASGTGLTPDLVLTSTENGADDGESRLPAPRKQGTLKRYTEKIKRPLAKINVSKIGASLKNGTLKVGKLNIGNARPQAVSSKPGTAK